MTSMIPVYPGRPPVLKTKEGVWVYVSMHDQAYLRALKDFRAQLVATHPDRCKTKRAVIRWRGIQARLKLFLQKEATWYYRLGLMPPGKIERVLEAPANWRAPQLNNKPTLGPRDSSHPRECLSYWHTYNRRCTCGYATRKVA